MLAVGGARRTGRRVRWRAPVLTAAVVVSVVLVSRTNWTTPRVPAHPTTHADASSPQSPAPRSSPVGHPSSSVTIAPPTRTRSPIRVATMTLRQMVRAHRPGSVSVAAYDVGSGQQVAAGATGGMLTASLVKLEFLETLLLRHQQAGTTLSDAERADAQEMIENSDNGAADDIYWDDAAGTGLDAAERRLGLSRKLTKPRGDDFWGLSTTSAPQQIALLKNLVLSSSPLSPANRRYALHLMENVEADERWGVPAVADDGSVYAVKNGWLAIDDDGGRWAVNSDGVVSVDGERMLISVMTQHDQSMQDGVALVQHFARAAAAVLVARRAGA
jgi:hypothetical protein